MFFLVRRPYTGRVSISRTFFVAASRDDQGAVEAIIDDGLDVEQVTVEVESSGIDDGMLAADVDFWVSGLDMDVVVLALRAKLEQAGYRTVSHEDWLAA